jgi:hypothetical protein
MRKRALLKVGYYKFQKMTEVIEAIAQKDLVQWERNFNIHIGELCSPMLIL